jgi:hypothetical protein
MAMHATARKFLRLHYSITVISWLNGAPAVMPYSASRASMRPLQSTSLAPPKSGVGIGIRRSMEKCGSRILPE